MPHQTCNSKKLGAGCRCSCERQDRPRTLQRATLSGPKLPLSMQRRNPKEELGYSFETLGMCGYVRFESISSSSSRPPPFVPKSFAPDGVLLPCCKNSSFCRCSKAGYRVFLHVSRATYLQTYLQEHPSQSLQPQVGTEPQAPKP